MSDLPKWLKTIELGPTSWPYLNQRDIPLLLAHVRELRGELEACCDNQVHSGYDKPKALLARQEPPEVK